MMKVWIKLQNEGSGRGYTAVVTGRWSATGRSPRAGNPKVGKGEVDNGEEGHTHCVGRKQGTKVYNTFSINTRWE
jgi:hypothetical protein